jgi:transcriptional regulator with XRE-family HTH domain
VTVGEAVKQARTDRGWSQLQLALAAGTTQAWIWKVETGAAAPSAGMLARLAATLELELRFGEYCLSAVEAPRLAS